MLFAEIETKQEKLLTAMKIDENWWKSMKSETHNFLTDRFSLISDINWILHTNN